MRGKLIHNPTVCPRARITPAHAGKTITRLSDIIGAEDHPRACGENNSVNLLKSTVLGSPPRMRGKPAR